MSDDPWAAPGAPPPAPPPGAGAGFPTVARPGSTPPPFAPPPGPSPWIPPPDRPVGRRPAWVVVVAVLVAVLVALTAATTVFTDSNSSPSEYGTADSEEFLGPAVPELPPSQRGELPATTLPPTSLPPAPAEGGPGAESGSDDAAFVELTCQFTGTSRLGRPLSLDDWTDTPPNTMSLQPGASFDCTDGTARSAGTLELSAEFEGLNAEQGVGAGQGRIQWTELPEERRVSGELAPVSTTGVEVQLDLPLIVVWTTITDGPYAGYRGRLVLRDWEPLFGEGGIVGTRFLPTSTTFAPG